MDDQTKSQSTDTGITTDPVKQDPMNSTEQNVPDFSKMGTTAEGDSSNIMSDASLSSSNISDDTQVSSLSTGSESSAAFNLTDEVKQTNSSSENSPSFASPAEQDLPYTTPPQPTMEPGNPGTNSAVTTTPGSKGSKKIPLVIILLILITVAVYGVVVSLYTQNSRLKNQNEQDTLEQAITTPEPTQAFNPNYIQIVNGSIHNTDPAAGETNVVLVDKNNFIEDTGIAGFARLVVSSDSKSMCFESHPPAPSPAIYTSTIQGESVIKVSVAKTNCLWNLDSTKIYYTDITATESDEVNIYEYTLATGLEKNITHPDEPMQNDASASAMQKTESKYYAITGLSPDGKRLNCSYTTVQTPTAEKTLCTIDLSTYTITDLGADSGSSS